MPAADFLAVLDNVRQHTNPNKVMIAITGGEPLLRKDLEEIGAEIYRRGFPWGIVTNGTTLTEKRLQSLLHAGLRSVTVSLDGLKESHEWLRGKNTYDKTIKSIAMLAKADDLVFDVVTCVDQKNITELNDLRTLLSELNVPAWRLFTIFSKGRATQYPELFLENAQFRQLLDFIADNRKTEPIASYGCEGFLGEYEGKVRDGFFFCRAGVNISSVLIDGTISACPSMRYDYAQGNIYQDDFWDVWQNKYEKMRNRAWTKTGQCANCASYKWCEGNGLHLRDENTGELLHCHLDKLSL